MKPPEIKSLRLSLGITQAEAAALCCVAPNTWARWERGEMPPKGPSLKILSILPALAKTSETAPAKRGKTRRTAPRSGTAPEEHSESNIPDAEGVQTAPALTAS